MEVHADHGRKALDDLELQVHEGEIVGIAGVAGNGQKELAEVLNGLRSWKKGSIVFNGQEIKTASVRHMIEAGVAHVPENRMKSGLAGGLGAVDNLLFKSYRTDKRSRFGFLRTSGNRDWSKSLVEKFDVKTPDIDTPVQQMSGGNQQKLLFAREIDHDPLLMVAVHPTQGLDVGATEGVHRLLTELRDAGRAVLLLSEDLDEVLQLSDRVLVMYNGRIVGEMSGTKRIGKRSACTWQACMGTRTRSWLRRWRMTEGTVPADVQLRSDSLPPPKRKSWRIEIDPTRSSSPWWMTVVSVALALVVCGIFIWANGMNPLAVYKKMVVGAFGTSFGITETLVKSIPLLLCGLGVSVAYRISVWNIGAEGQFALGAIFATSVTIYFPEWPIYLSIPAMVVMGILGGGLWDCSPLFRERIFKSTSLLHRLCSIMWRCCCSIISYSVLGKIRRDSISGLADV
ncbi:ATP-binding cassette domain-containing protein [Cohnella faecalis]|uniref:ATP-binding cassette domain-containing protein n=1 Tax=Cohnella faecalis TaxID=2315694 RepID=UPI0022795EE4|nr:ATP-binding cassette domain-containing protein [Cohnella faecalis]